jgi:pSer/pThr/pTyr-binding forkhead associated (FHA) protein
MTPRLMARRDDGTVRSVLIRNETKIGSAEGNDVVIHHGSVLPVHAIVGLADGQMWVEDAGSPAGTRVNGERVTRSPIRHLDVLTVGDGVHIVVLTNDVAGSATRMVPPSGGGPPVGFDGGTLQPGVKVDRPIIGVRLIGPTGTFELKPGQATVGRRDSTISIESKDVSRKHAVVSVTPDKVTVEDLNSANGTTLNGKPITAPVPVREGDRITFATFAFKVTFIRLGDDQ